MKSPSKLPWCTYPKSANTAEHGLLEMPREMPIVNFESIQKFRSDTYQAVPTSHLSLAQIDQMAQMMAVSFAINEPMNKHVHPPKSFPSGILNFEHQDPFGLDSFGPWTTENILYWFVRLLILSSPSDARGNIGLNKEVIKHSLAIVENGTVIGGSLNMSLSPKKEAIRTDDPFLDAVFLYQNPIVNFFYEPEGKAISALCDQFPLFRAAYQNGKVGYISMIARSPELPSLHTFELFASSFQHFQKEGFEYMLVTGTNNWTGAACEAFGAARIYFLPFRGKQRLAIEAEAKENEPYSSDGYISAKDSGAMIYLAKLR